MPISLRIIEPVRLGKGYRCASTDDANAPPNGSNLIVSQTVANTILSRALLQLTSLVKHADGIFTNLSDECRKVYDRTNRINTRILTITECVQNLNPKREPIRNSSGEYLECFTNLHRTTDKLDLEDPASIDLKTFHKNSPPFDAKHGYECNLFTVESRPCSVKDLYSTADISPSEGLSALDGIRKDGWSGSTMFKLWPVANKDISISTPDFSSSRKNPPVQFQKIYKTLKVPHRSQTANSFDHLNMIEDCDDQSDLSKSQPSILVSIDTSGASFERMCLYRRSLRDSVTDKSLACTRRRSISGLPESIVNEIKNFEARKRNSRRFSSVPRRYPRTYSFNDLDPVHSRDEAFAKYFEEIEGKLDERNEWDNMMKKSFLSKIISCSKSQSAPHNQKSKFQKLLRTNSHKHKGASEDFDMKSLVQTNSNNVKQNRRKSSFIGDRIKHFMKIGGKAERKSLDLSFLKIPEGYLDNLDDAKLSLVKTISMPERICEAIPEPAKTIEEDSRSGQFYNFSNNTLPRAQAKKYDFPWESLPKDWTTSVRLREISKRRKEERHSSSGNWSATSSARQSIESDQTNMTITTDHIVSSTASFCSLGQDSGRDSAMETEDRHFSDTAECGGDEMSTFTGEASDRDSLNTELYKLDALVHRRNLHSRAFNQDNTSSSSIESNNCYSKTGMIPYDPEMLLPDSSQFKQQDDEVSSLYSLDEDGFYTSFHSDSGLKAMKNMTKTRMSELSEIYSKFLGRKKCQNSGQAADRNHIIENIYDQELEAEMREERDKTPTREISCPRRLSSPTESETSDSTLTNTSNRNSLVTGGSESNYSESDHEIIYKHIKNMTTISPKSFPSWCIISSSGSDEDSSNQLLVGQKTEMNSSSSGNSLAVGGATTTSTDSRDSDDGGNTLPRNYLASEKWDLNKDKTGSWPRSHNSSNEGKKQGILKSSFRKDSDCKAKMPKSLNFSPYVNMLPAGNLQTQHCLLSDLSAKHYSSMPEHNSFTSTSSMSSSTTICNDDASTVSSVSDSDFDFLPSYPTPISNTTNQKSFSIETEPNSDIIHNNHETLVSCQQKSSLEPLTNSVIIRKPLAQLANNNNIQLGAMKEETNLNGVKHCNSSSLNQQLPSPEISPPSAPCAVSFIPNALSSFPITKNRVSQNSVSFAVKKPVLRKVPVVETVVINTSNNNNNNNNNNSNGVAVDNSIKRLSLTTFTLPPTSQEASEKRNSTDNVQATPRVSVPDTNRPDTLPDGSQPESSDSSCKYNTRNGSYRVAMYEESEEEPKRLDSYRVAITASNKITDDSVNRKGSYRVAVQDNSNQNNSNNNAEPTNRSDSYRVAMKVESSDRRCKSFNKDIRRQGITDINQLKMDDDQQFDSFTNSSVQKPASFKSKMSSVFGGGKSDSQLLTKSQNSKKKYPKGNTYLTESTSLSTLKNLGKKQSSSNQSSDLHSFKNLVSQQTPSTSPKTSAVEVLKRKPSPPFSKDISSESGNRSILAGLFQRPSSWGGTSKVNPKMSTYISFDTIFEDKEILSNASSIESLRSPSLTSIKKIGDPNNLHPVKFNHGLKADRKSLLEVNKRLSEEEQRNRKKRLAAGAVDDKAVQSVLDSIKTTIKSMTSRSDSAYKQQSSAS